MARSLRCFSFMLLTFVGLSFVAYAAVPDIEREALLSLYNSTNGKNWKNQDGWDDPILGTECSWYGVACSEGHVAGLFLDNNNLKGSIPLELENLSRIQYLFLTGNELTDILSTGMGDTTVECDTGIPYHERIALFALYNSTSGDDWTHRDGWDNPTRGTECSWYGVTCSPDCNVTAISLDDNNLKGTLPSELGYLSNVQYLFLQNNRLTGSIPSEIGFMTDLIQLTLYNNQLTGSIPGALGNLTNLEFFFLHRNRLDDEIPNGLGSCKKLRFIYLYENQLSGGIPERLGKITALEQLVLYNNKLSGSIPVELGNLANLEQLSLYNNRLIGKIPESLGNLASLKFFFLQNNHLSGSIPSTLMNLTNLVYFDICNNHLYTKEDALRTFLNSYLPNWEDCQTPLPTVPTITPILLDN